MAPKLSHMVDSLVKEADFDTRREGKRQIPSIPEVGGSSSRKTASKGKGKAVSDKKGLSDFIKKHFLFEEQGSPMDCNARPPNTTIKKR